MKKNNNEKKVMQHSHLYGYNLIAMSEEEHMRYHGLEISFVKIFFDEWSFRQRLWFCWQVLTKKVSAIGTKYVKFVKDQK
jgi:hypothetical protein